jgi:glycine cleavage system H protein
VIAINETLTDAPEKLNEDPHGAAWLVKLKLSAVDETKDLMTAVQYQEYLGT